MKGDAIRQREYRERRAVKLARLDRTVAALIEIVQVLAENEKPLAVKLREIAMRGLADPQPEKPK